MTSSVPCMIALAAVLVLTGCDDTLFGQQTTPPTYTPDWPGMVAFVDDHCVRCHTPGGIASPEFPSAIAADVLAADGVYVVAGEPDASLLWRVVSDTRLEADPPAMPFGTGPLPVAQIDHVREWILAGAPVEDTDADGDGYGIADGDCDDRDDTIWPGAVEVCDHADNDCDGEVDEGLTTPGWADADGDGFGDPDAPIDACPGEGATNGDDCDDTDDTVNPDATADPFDGIDQDCDGTVEVDPTLTTSHALDIQPIWDARCTDACHAAVVPAGGLRLNGNAWPDLVNKPSGQAPMDLVEPFEPPTSYLWRKLNDTHLPAGGSGSDMPKRGDPLTTTQLQLIETWILEGAPQ